MTPGGLLSGPSEPGPTRWPSIAGLVQDYGIARTTAARALRVLVDEGLAEVVPGWEPYVTER
jgi:DNA-binding GntR family transcriptional regulator